MRVRSVITFVTLGIVAALTVAAPASAHRGRELSTSLTGAAEVPGPGDPDGVGTASLRFDHGFRGICFEIHVAGIALPATAAHIHLGIVGGRRTGRGDAHPAGRERQRDGVRVRFQRPDQDDREASERLLRQRPYDRLSERCRAWAAREGI